MKITPEKLHSLHYDLATQFRETGIHSIRVTLGRGGELEDVALSDLTLDEASFICDLINESFKDEDNAKN